MPQRLIPRQPPSSPPGRIVEQIDLIEAARAVLAIEARGLTELAASLDDSFIAAITLLAQARAHVVVTGMGKSGHVGTKIAATLASTGTPAFFVHPSEASHGDLGMITPATVVLALSNSGETPELANLVAYTRRFAIPLLAITGRAQSTLARQADVALVLPPVEEACPHGLAPTTSTTMTLALGDALAIGLLRLRGFTPEDFHTFHPGGRLGNILVRVRDIMHGAEELPIVHLGTSMSEALIEMSQRGFGCTAVLDAEDRLTGIITDGDLRRHMAPNLAGKSVDEVMSPRPKTIGPDALGVEALKIMNNRGITSLLVVEREEVIGIIHIHDCLRSGIS